MENSNDIAQKINDTGWRRLLDGGELPEYAADELTRYGLPIPSPIECFSGTQNKMIFLNEYGLVVRFECNMDSKLTWALQQDHPNILQPLVQEIRKDYIFEIIPAVALLTPRSLQGREPEIHPMPIIKELQKELMRHEINFWDPQTENCGFIQDPNSFDKIHPVILDRNAVKKLGHSTYEIKKKLEISQSNPQAVFTPLREAFQSVRQAKNQSSAREFQRKAYKIARQFVENRTLVCGWHSVNVGECKTQAAYSCAQDYEEKLRIHHQKTLNI